MKKIFLSMLAFFVPAVVSAQATAPALSSTITDADGVVGFITRFFNIAIYVLISFAVLYLVYYIVIYFVKGDSESKSEVAKNIGYGILGLFIILSIWGLVNIVKSTFRTNNNLDTSNIPQSIINRN